MSMYVDFLGGPDSEQHRNELRKLLRDELEARLEESVARQLDLPPLMVELQSPEDEYLGLLREARELYIDGRFYACVAMCGIVGERLVKDVLRRSLLVRRGSTAHRPTDASFIDLERVEASKLTGFLNKAELLSDDGAKAATQLTELRNSYAHARGRDAKGDARKAVAHLHRLVEHTVSMLPGHRAERRKPDAP